jgi:hypothetical protein
MANGFLQDYREAVAARVFHAVVEEIETFARAALAVIGSPFPFEPALASVHGIKSTVAHDYLRSRLF